MRSEIDACGKRDKFLTIDRRRESNGERFEKNECWEIFRVDERGKNEGINTRGGGGEGRG